MSNLDLSVFDRDVLVQVSEMLQFLRENERYTPVEHHYAQIEADAPSYVVQYEDEGIDVARWDITDERLTAIIARAMLALEAMNE